ncbi:MAG: hypothetical protein WAW85_13260 [Gordonia sp. (in: high G+C Gram-positive bacteria)]|uniref:hypothetical protein n=1 Tax=Gordonia sp. (in: high G+C Gram-positive bacteria) TaxID=84139 RepID=UPI003BB4D6BF
MVPELEVPALARRLAAFGAVARMTGFDDVVTFSDEGLILDDDDYLRLGRDGNVSNSSGTGAVPRAWSTDARADQVITDWIEQYLEDTYQFLVIRRDYIGDLVADPFSELYVSRLADRFPNVDLPAIEEFLGGIRRWLGGLSALA